MAGAFFGFADAPFHHRLGGDAGVVGARHPKGVEALHAPPADEDVLQGVVQGVAQVQRAGDVGRRDDDGVGRARGVGIAVEEAVVFPEPQPALLRLFRVVLPGQFGRHESPPSSRTILSSQRRTALSSYHNDNRHAAKARGKAEERKPMGAGVTPVSRDAERSAARRPAPRRG